jgi:hypothetical protein
MSWLMLGLGAALAMPPATQGAQVFRVDFSNPALTPSNWTMILHPDGSGHFHSVHGNAPPADMEMEPRDVDRDIHVSGEFAQRVFQEVHDHPQTSGGCESHMKVAFQGWKKLSYTGPDGGWSCEFNYSRDKQIQSLSESLMAVAGTILEGARLEMLLQHDRLGLDKEMEFISDAAGDGRLMQICAIKGILERLADDDEVMERVRKRAKVLLAKSDQSREK